MPTRADVLGFGNNWYQPALDAAIEAALPSGRRIYMVTAPYFLATKLAAFDGRGAGDYVMSHDMENVVAVAYRASYDVLPPAGEILTGVVRRVSGSGS